MAYKVNTFGGLRPQRQYLPEQPDGNPPLPPSTPGGDGGVTGGPAAPPVPLNQCPAGQVWRTDSHMGVAGPGCEPPDWRSTQGVETCTGARPNCPPGQGVWCDFDDAQFKCAPDGSAGGGRGGGGRGAGGGPIQIPGLEEGKTLWDAILKMLQGPSRYTPEVMSALLGQTRATAEAGALRQTEESQADLARRGILRSPIAAEAQRGIRANVYQTVLAEQNKIARAKIDADFQDRVEGIKSAQAWLDSLRQYVAAANATKAQRDAAMANIALGYARLSQEMDLMREQYQQQLNLWLITQGGGK